MLMPIASTIEPHAHAFYDLESEICDLVRATTIVVDVAFDLKHDEDAVADLTFYAAQQAQRAAKELKEKWYALHAAAGGE